MAVPPAEGSVSRERMGNLAFLPSSYGKQASGGQVALPISTKDGQAHLLQNEATGLPGSLRSPSVSEPDL